MCTLQCSKCIANSNSFNELGTKLPFTDSRCHVHMFLVLTISARNSSTSKCLDVAWDFLPAVFGPARYIGELTYSRSSHQLVTDRRWCTHSLAPSPLCWLSGDLILRHMFWHDPPSSPRGLSSSGPQWWHIWQHNLIGCLHFPVASLPPYWCFLYLPNKLLRCETFWEEPKLRLLTGPRLLR